MRSLVGAVNFVMRKFMRAILTEYAREHRVKPLIFCAVQRFRRPWPRVRTVYYLNPKLKVDTAIVMPIFNRPEYLQQTYDSLLQTQLERALLIMVDDGSDDTTLLENFHSETNHIKIYKNKNIGMWHSYQLGFDLALQHFSQIKYLVTLDSDTIHARDWLSQIINLYEAHRADEPLVTGFNTASHYVTTEHEDYVVKHSVGGINLLFSPDMYRRHFRRAFHWHQNWWDFFFAGIQNRLNQPILVTKPSVIQHIGHDGRNASTDKGLVDLAVDFVG